MHHIIDPLLAARSNQAAGFACSKEIHHKGFTIIVLDGQ